jgi:hypothetical protein
MERELVQQAIPTIQARGEPISARKIRKVLLKSCIRASSTKSDEDRDWGCRTVPSRLWCMNLSHY